MNQDLRRKLDRNTHNYLDRRFATPVAYIEQSVSYNRSRLGLTRRTTSPRIALCKQLS
jgi:hypothetical protein